MLQLIKWKRDIRKHAEVNHSAAKMPRAVKILIPFEFYALTLLVIQCVTFMRHGASLVMTSGFICLLHSNCF